MKSRLSFSSRLVGCEFLGFAPRGGAYLTARGRSRLGTNSVTLELTTL